MDRPRHYTSSFEVLEPRQVLAGLTLSASLIQENAPAGTALGELTVTADAGATPPMEFVQVRDPGNSADPRIQTDGASGIGAVGYDFSIGKYEVTVAQYVEFLNACAKSDVYGLYDARMSDTINRGGVSGIYSYTVQPYSADKPITWVSFFDAARFSNWMNSGKAPGSTETGAYELNGLNPIHVARNAEATFWIPSEDEWYKSTYYSAATAGYWLYPTQSDTVPVKTQSDLAGRGLAGPSGNSANYGRADGDRSRVTDIGTNGGPSGYGAFDLGGNVQEWNDTELVSSPYAGATYSRGVRGSDFLGSFEYLKATERQGDCLAGFSVMNLGFRMAGKLNAGVQSFNYSLVAGAGDSDNGSFSIVGNLLESAVSFDHEKTASLTVRIRVTDQAGAQVESPFVITVGNVNESPTGILFSASGGIPENEPSGTLAGVLSASDGDANDSFTYALVAGPGDADNGLFTLLGGELRTVVTLDYESHATLSIRVKVTDKGGLSTERVFPIAVTNVNEAPIGIALSANSILENQPAGAAVGVLSVNDPDVGNTFSFSLIAGAGATDNALFRIVGKSLKTVASFDYEGKQSYEIRVSVTDEGGLSYERKFRVFVTNVDEPPTDIVLSRASIEENQPAGSLIGSLTTGSPDSLVTFTYALVGSEGASGNAAFFIDGTGLKAVAPLNYESKSSYTVRIRSTDQHGLWIEKSFTINVADAREPLAIDHIDSPAPRLYRAGEILRFEVVLTRPVTVIGRPEVALQVGAAKAKVIYQSGSGSSRLAFTYADKAGDNAPGGVVLGNTLRLPSGASIRLDSTSLPLGLPLVDASSVRVDTTPPKVSQTSGPPARIYKAGDVLWFSASMSEAVAVSGLPALPLVVGSSGRQAIYNVGRSGPTTLVFGYVVQAGDNDSNGITVGNSIVLPAGADVADGAGNRAVLAIRPPALTAVLVDTSSPAITAVTAPAAKTFRAGEAIDFKLAFSEPVQVTGTPALAVVIGASVRSAAFVGFAPGTGNRSLVFRTIPITGDVDPDGLTVSVKMVLDDAVVTDSVGNRFNGILPGVDARNVLVDAVVPSIASVSAFLLNAAGSLLAIRVSFTETVVVTGKPTVGFRIGGSNRTLVYASGSGTAELAFVYAVNKKTDDMKLPVTLGSTIVLTGATIRDRAGNTIGSAAFPKSS